MSFKPADLSAALAELRRDGTTVDLVEGETYKFPSGLQKVGEGTTFDGHGATIIALNPCRLVTEEPGAVLRDFSASGYFTLYNYASKFLAENVAISHSLDGKTILDHGLKAAATAAFMTWLRLAQTKKLEKISYVGCKAEGTYHHGFSMNLEGGSEGGTFYDVLFDKCLALTCGKADRAPRDGTATPIDYENWACCFNVPDAGSLNRATFRDCEGGDPVQDCFHMDGSWDGHRMDLVDVLFERCYGHDAGRRCSTQSVEKFWHGIYGPHFTARDCRFENNRHAGMAIINSESNRVDVRGCVDVGSAYGMILNYSAFGAKVQFTSKAAKVRAFVGQGGSGGGTLDLTIIDPPNVAVTLGRALRADYIDCPNHLGGSGGQTQKYDAFGYTLDGSKITIRGEAAVEVWKTSHVTGKIAYLPLEAVEEEIPPVVVPDTPEVPVVVLPPPDETLGAFRPGPFNTVLIEVPSLGRSVPLEGEIREDLRRYFQVGRLYVPESK
jgi:hypothetical protein